MRLRHPPGRGGRLWLQHRIEVATRGADLLEKKRRALLQELRRVRALARETQAEWESTVTEAQAWVDRAAIIAGEEKLRILAATHAQASVTVRWQSSMGVTYPAEARVDLGPAPPATVGGSAAADAAMVVARRAVVAGVNDAAAHSALRRISRELAVTSRRHRALERRWLPALREAASRLDERLDELEREEATRSAWAGRRAESRR